MLPLFGLPAFAQSLEYNAKTLFVVLEDVGTNLNANLTAQIFDIFFDHGIPVTATLNLSKNTPISADVVNLIKTTLARERGLFEVALEVDEFEESLRYFQYRAAIDLRDQIVDKRYDSANPENPTPIVSILNRGQQDLLDPFAMRAAGLRVQMRPAQDNSGQIVNADTEFAVLDWGHSLISGGHSAEITSDPEAELRNLNGPSKVDLLYLSFPVSADLAPEALLEQCRTWAARLQVATLKENTFLTRPMDYLIQGNPGASKFMALVLDKTGDSGPDNRISEFANRLDRAGLPYTSIVATTSQAGVGECIFVEDTATISHENSARCLVLEQNEIDIPTTSSAIIVLHKSEDPYFFNGLRSDGRYHAAIRAVSAIKFTSLLKDDPLTDQMLVIQPEHVETRIQQEALIEQFSQARSDGAVHYYSARGFVYQTVAPDPVVERFWSNQRRQLSDPATKQRLDDSTTEKFLEDARLAWLFIERFSDEETGICAGTVKTGVPRAIDYSVTLWDVASQLNAIKSATVLSLISKEDAQERVGKVLAHLPAIRLDGLTFPPSVFRSNNLVTSKREFDACDTGRFLVALDRLVKAEFISRESALAVLEKWDLAGVLKDRRPFNFTNGRWEDVLETHCSHYARNGYIAWGMNMDTAYPSFQGDAFGDQRIRLLHKAAFIGHFGAEPLLLEKIEVGGSPESTFLSEILFDAQLSWFENTGQFKCVSETPLDFAPWFAFQGLRVDRQGQEEWVITAASKDPSYKSSAFLERADIISSKAAYLWAAAYPHDHSNRLVKLVRENARIEGFGFSVGLFANTMTATQDYSDVNTNGIILTAIEQILQNP